MNCPCAGGACQIGLTCRDGLICVDGTGYTGGPCFSNGTCTTGNRCTDETCTPCLLGSMGCACNAGSCNAGLECAADICIEEGALGQFVPEDPECFTPCQSGFVDSDGTYRACPADGYMEGCIDDYECVNGTCALPGETELNCVMDTDCPGFQACVAGTCYATCNEDEDCPTGLSCFEHVCRLPCTNSGSNCPTDLTCVSDDGDAGHCLPLSDPTGETDTLEGGFELDVDYLGFSNVTTEAAFTITNESATYQTFRIRKRYHQASFEDGTSETYLDADDDESCDPAVDCPLFWLEMGETADVTRVQEFEVGIDAGESMTIELAAAGSYNAVRWTGTLEVIHDSLPTREIALDYQERPDGQWSGNIFYFANFGTRELDDWRADPMNQTELREVGNAFVRRWGAFRRGFISWEEFQAVMTATESESWRWPSVENACDLDNGACYLYDISADGLVEYSLNLDSNPIPTGVTELPFAMNLYLPDMTADSGQMVGRIESSMALQYAGNPGVTLGFETSATECDRDVNGVCLTYINEFSADIFVGGRYTSDVADTNCSDRSGGGYEQVAIPWLVPGFERETDLDSATLLRYRYECRDSYLPFNAGPGAESMIPADYVDANVSLASSNPIPDGRTRVRRIRLVDGALINQSLMFILFEEEFESFIPDGETFSAFGYMVLRRSPTTLDLTDEDGDMVPEAYEGSIPADTREVDLGWESQLHVECSEDIVEELLGYNNDSISSPAEAAEVMTGLITGVVPTVTPEIVTDVSAESVHYLCVETGLFDGGPENFTPNGVTISNNNRCGFASAGDNFYDNNGSCDDGGPGSLTSICELGTDQTDCGDREQDDADFRESCPVTSDVIYFTIERYGLPGGVEPQEYIAALDCQQDGTCDDTLADWRNGGAYLVQYQPSWRCEDSNAIYCDLNRDDLRDGKEFYLASEEAAVFTPLYAEIDLAFRYKTQFRSSSGDTPGYAPQICIPGSNQIPYCYDPEVIEEIRLRVDCLLHIWEDWYDDLTVTDQATLNDYLCTNFSYAEACHPTLDPTTIHDGFERLYSELLVMMGDDAYTEAFASRFDLAGTNTVSFEGELFEPNGINLSGAAGFEMYNLYMAVEYYQEALDRFYGMSPLVWDALQYGSTDARNFVTPETVIWYMDRLIRASTQKSRAYSEIAERYQSFNRPDLARQVVERAYTATYIESVALSQLMLRITDALRPQDRPQVVAVLEETQLRYRMALLDMRGVYESITDSLTFFGFPPEYIPFPTVNAREDTAFDIILQRARQRVAVARGREDAALQRARGFAVDAEQFQSELVQLRNTYENQLGDLCGTFEAPDGRIYPAIRQYAYLLGEDAEIGDPCGLVGNGQIHRALAQFEISQIGLQEIRVQMQNVLDEVEIERSRAEAQCNRIVDLADYVYETRGQINDMRDAVNGMQFAIGRLNAAIWTRPRPSAC